MGADNEKKKFLEGFLEKLEILSILIFILAYRHPDYRHPDNLLTFTDIF